MAREREQMSTVTGDWLVAKQASKGELAIHIVLISLWHGTEKDSNVHVI
jgi:hypothetical protein